MRWTEKQIQEDDSGCKEASEKRRIRKKGFLLMGLVLAGLVIFGTMQQGLQTEKMGSEKPAAGKAAGQNASSTQQAASVQQKTDSQAAEKTDALKGTGSPTSEKTDASKGIGSSSSEKTKTSKEAVEQDRSYDFTLGFAGDICLADNYIPMQHLAAIGSEDISDGIDPRFIEIMKGMDQMWINNEFVYSRRGEPLPTKMWTFCGDPDNVSYLKDLGVDIVGLANNHTFDFGEVSFLDTLETLEKAQIPYVGAGRDIEQAAAPVYLEADGFKIAYVAASRAEYTIYTPEAAETEPGILWCYDYTRFLESIKTAAENADYVIFSETNMNDLQDYVKYNYFPLSELQTEVSKVSEFDTFEFESVAYGIKIFDKDNDTYNNKYKFKDLIEFTKEGKEKENYYLLVDNGSPNFDKEGGHTLGYSVLDYFLSDMTV